MKFIFYVFLIFAITITGGNAAETNALPTSITIGLETYEDVTWGAVTPSTVSIHHKTGIAKIPLAKLPPELQQRFGYDPAIAASHRTQELAAQAQFQAANVEAAKRRWEKHQADVLAAEAAKATNQITPAEIKSKPKKVFTVRYAAVFNIQQASDGYTANIITDTGSTMLVMFDQRGLDFMTRSMRGKQSWGTVYAVEVNTSVINVYGTQTSDIAFRLVGSGEHTDITGATTYSW